MLHCSILMSSCFFLGTGVGTLVILSFAFLQMIAFIRLFLYFWVSVLLLEGCVVTVGPGMGAACI